MKYTLLKEKIKEEENGMSKTAAAIGITEEKLGFKLEGKIPLLAYEVFMICKVNNIVTLNDRLAFFYPDRPKSGTKERRIVLIHKDGKDKKEKHRTRK